MWGRLREWVQDVWSTLSDWYDEAKTIGSNFVEWCRDAPVIVAALFWVTAGLFGWLYLVGHFPKWKPVIRLTGVFLQLFGFILAAYGLERRLEEFGQTPSTSRILTWLWEFLSIFAMGGEPMVVEQDAPARLVMRAHGGDIEKQEDLSLKEQVEKLSGRIDELETEIHRRIDEERERLEARIEEKFGAVEENVQEMGEKLKEVNVGEGALWMEWSGVSFFVYGVPLASFPSSFLPAYRVLIIPLVAGTLLGLLHWYAD